MTSKSGKVFSLGHLIVPLILVTLSLQAKPGQAFLLGMLALLTLGWAVFLLFHSYYLNRSYPFERRKTYLAFMMIDFAWLTAVSCLPDWSASEIRPVWLVLFPVALYAFEGGMLHSLGMSLLGMISLYLFTEYQGQSFWSVEVFLTGVGMAALVGFIGWRTERLNRIAYYDGLTGLPNRLMMVEKLQTALSQRRPSSSAAVLLLDLDQFKYVNDTMGHDTGDDLLKSVAHRIRQVLPRSAMLARMGGDEFSVLMPSPKHSDEAASAAERILEALKKSFPLNGEEVYIGASVGIAVSPDDGKDAAALLKHAETALYRAKEQGRNNYQFYTPTVHTKGIKRLQMETMLRHALDRNELVVYYQPRLDARTGKLVCVEALVRWKHPQIGMIPPDDFIPLAEDTGLITRIGETVLKQACRQRQLWNRQGVPPFRVSVNLSPRQFRQMDLPEVIHSILADTGLAPEYLELEITESAAMQDVNYAILMLKVLKEMGLTIAIDDFGTGYSSLSYLKRFPIDVIKVDQSFIRGIKDDSEDAAIVQAIIVLAHSLNLDVTAEGVETSEQLEFLKNQQCNEIQGYLIGKPMSAETLRDWIVLENTLSASSGSGRPLFH